MAPRLLIIIGLFFPYLVSAAVSISEVAWMGSVSSANHEWIELHNAGSAVDVTGWKLVDDMNLSIELTGVIPPEQYVVLERTSDASAPGTAFLIYTGSLVNTGATLSLLRSDGSLVDRLTGGEGWQLIGGDNVTKETAQYTTKGWVTAAATPGRDITSNEVDVAAASRQSSSKESATAGTRRQEPEIREKTILTLPGVTLVLQMVAPTVGYVNQEIPLSVIPSGVGKVISDSLVYEWNFGDGDSGAGRETSHIFRYPGTYVITTYGSYERQEQIARREVTILPVVMSLTMNQAGDLQVNNDSPYEIDISGYRVVADKTFTFPARSFVLPNQTVTIAKSHLGDTVNRLVTLYDSAGLAINSHIPTQLTPSYTTEVAEIEQKPVPRISAISTSQTPMIQTSDFGFASDAAINEPTKVSEFEENMSEEISTPKTQLASVNQAKPSGSEYWPYLALVGILIVGTLGVYATPKPKSNEIE